MTQLRAIVVADDLTGAADAGAPYGAAGFATVVPLRSTPGHAEVLAISNDTRDASGDRIEALFERSMQFVPPVQHVPLWYAKVDSVFRGHPGPQVAFLLRRTGRRSAVIAPALPDQGRVTVDGNVYVGDRLLAETSLGAGRTTSAVIELLGLPPDLGRSIGLDTVRSGADALRAAIERSSRPIIVVDAETNEDLATLAAATIDSTTHLLAGSAGFSKQLAGVLGFRHGHPGPQRPEADIRSVLIVAGSRHAASVRQVAALEATGVDTIRVNFERGHLDPAVSERIVERMAAAFDANRPVTITTAETPNSLLPGAEIARALAALATDSRVRDRFQAAVLTGGDVASAVCDQLAAESIGLDGEVLPAIPWGTLLGGHRPGLPIVTKAGSFGSDTALVDTVRFFVQRTKRPSTSNG